MNPIAAAYESTAHQLRDRIIEIAKKDPTILDVDGAFGMFKHGLQCDDLEPSLAQAGWALAAARKEMGWTRKGTP